MWKQEDLEFEAIPGKSSGVTVSKTKQNKKKRAGGKAQVVEYLPSKFKALGSGPN
jgi:hypothetical protein